MLVGSGGVVALVIGGWGVLWAVAATRGRDLQEWYPTAAAFVAAMVAVALIGGQSEVVLGWAGLTEASAAARHELGPRILSYSLRPLIGAALGSAALFAAALAVHLGAEAGAASSRSPSLPLRLGVALLVAAVVLDLFVFAWLRAVFASLLAGERDALGGVSTLQAGAWLGFFLSLYVLACALIVAFAASKRSFSA